MLALITHEVIAAALPLAAAGHRGGRAVFWIAGWFAALTVVGGAAVWILRRRRHAERGDR